MRIYICVVSCLIIISNSIGCATSPDKISAAYVSPMQFNSYDCDQIFIEMDRVSRKCVELEACLKKKASNDEAAMAVGMVLFWPAYF